MIFVKTICQPKPNFEIHPITRVRGKIKLSSLKLDKKRAQLSHLSYIQLLNHVIKERKKKKRKIESYCTSN